jgi:flagellar protein FlaF
MKETAQSEPFDPLPFLHAARLNWRLWTIFQAEISSPDCQLPVEIRQNMIALCNFVDKMTVDLITDPKPRKVDSLININREIAAGLLASSQNSEAEAAAQSTSLDPVQPARGAVDQTS